MGLSSSMWTSVSGLLAHGEKMNVISNNLANVSTIGFKSQRMDFEDFVYQDSFSGGGPTQIGFGVGINTIVTDFSQGSFESTNNSTDLAINGTGFFKVVNPETNGDYYTRAGNFNFNNQGYLTLPSGEVLQGWEVDNADPPLPATGINPLVSEPQGIQTLGSPSDIVLDTWTLLPKATTKVEFSVNLTAEPGLDKSSDSINNPLFAMSESWDGKHAVENPDDPPLSKDAYVFAAPMDVYDEAGNVHALTCYFDQVPEKRIDPVTGDEVDTITGLPTGYAVYEYLLTMDPSEDARTFGGTYDEATGVLTGATSFQDTEAAGILMKGTMIFNANGELVSQSAYTYMGNTETPAGDPTTANPDDASSWQPTAISDSGYPVFTANFSGHPMANSVGQSKTEGDMTKSKDAHDILIEFDLGLQSESPSDPWAMGGNPATKPGAASSIADLMTAAAGGGATSIDYANLALLVPAETDNGASTNLEDFSDLSFSSQDGYGSGSLSNARIDANGVLYGIYNNGIEMPLYQIAMYDFVNPQGLYREGGNLYSETAESGSIQLAQAGIAGMGQINAYNIEQSNVDMSVEFVQMIVTQRGFQGNSKGITTVDTMLEQVINMKR